MKLKFLIFTFLYLFSFLAKADMVQDIVNRYKSIVDPDNNHEQRCSLISVMVNKVRSASGWGDCSENYCLVPINNYRFKDNKWDVGGYSFWMLYQIYPFKIIGREIDIMTLEDYKGNKDYIEKTHYFQDITKDKHFYKLSKERQEQYIQKNKEAFAYGSYVEDPKTIKADTSYIKITGCRVDEFKIISKNSPLLTTKNE